VLRRSDIDEEIETGFDGSGADAYKHAMRVLGEVDAKVFVVESARRFLTLDTGKHCDEFIGAMNGAGYRVQARAMNAAGFGVPQDRKRSILVCTRIGVDVDPLMGYLFPEEARPTVCVADIMETGLPATLLDEELTDLHPEPAARVGKTHRVGLIRGKNSQGYRVYSTKGVGISLMAGSDGAAQFTGAYRVPGGARPLTPREAARMQGMPEWSAQHGNRRHALRHAGNAIALPLARELGRRLQST
jgi:DNA (cytosine-5)-methyltransferase 1